jgi:hypothetical protein
MTGSLTSPLLEIVIDLIEEFAGSRTLFKMERKRIRGLKPEA